MVYLLDITQYGKALMAAIRMQLGVTNELNQADRVYQELMTQIFMGLNPDPNMFMLYIKDMPSFVHLSDIEALNAFDTAGLVNTFREVAVYLYFQVGAIRSFPMVGHEHILKAVTINMAMVESYPS